MPPSMAVSASWKVDCCSRSKAFCKTNSAVLAPSLLVSIFRPKCSFGLIW
uniref:Uncharacterized protein n=1 Tax=Callorhinchus milii TaxID=7868 RepID=A0A4W3JQ82_CALMI